MRIQLHLFVLLLAACTSCRAGADRGSSAPAPTGVLVARFAAPARPWVVDVQNGQAKFLDLVASFEAASGERVSASDAVREQLAGRGIGLTANAIVPPEQVYTWFEALVAREGYRVAVVTQSEPRMLVLYGGSVRGMEGSVTPLHVDASELEELDRHPALYVQTVLDVAPLEARSLQNSLRALGPRMDSLISIGMSNSVIVAGSGKEVAAMLRLLDSARANETARLERERAPATPPIQPGPNTSR